MRHVDGSLWPDSIGGRAESLTVDGVGLEMLAKPARCYRTTWLVH